MTVTQLALSEGPSSAISETRKLREINLRDLLPTIAVPTLVLHRVEDPVEPLESGRYLAEHPGRHTHRAARAGRAAVGGGVRSGDRGDQPLPGRRGCAGGGPASTRSLATVLFTDVVGSTEQAAELGDVWYRQILERHHRVIRAELRRHGGIEVDTAGDGSFATFYGPARAIECALAICEAVRPLGIEVRAGVHTARSRRATAR
ncbi:MAG TPA: adenylate/guanylate cyclase domain-containing protein [Gemmatimonadota bacterium]|nr:adenylate/guanylate cyclase domain-containing protein [Gemmatimonadota bacterium]